MATKPLTSEAIALTEKKMDMTLDDIIKMSKTNTAKSKKQRAPVKSRRFPNGNQDKYVKSRQYLDSRSTLRQGVLAQRRSNFQGNNFPSAAEAARKAAVAPFHNRALGRNRAPNWSKPRAGGPLRRQGNASNGGNAFKQQRQQQQPRQTGEVVMPNHHQKPKTLDSLFANMKEQRMRTTTTTTPTAAAFTHTNIGGVAVCRGAVANQTRQPWLRGRFGNYRNW